MLGRRTIFVPKRYNNVGAKQLHNIGVKDFTIIKMVKEVIRTKHYIFDVDKIKETVGNEKANVIVEVTDGSWIPEESPEPDFNVAERYNQTLKDVWYTRQGEEIVFAEKNGVFKELLMLQLELGPNVHVYGLDTKGILTDVRAEQKIYKEDRLFRNQMTDENGIHDYEWAPMYYGGNIEYVRAIMELDKQHGTNMVYTGTEYTCLVCPVCGKPDHFVVNTVTEVRRNESNDIVGTYHNFDYGAQAPGGAVCSHCGYEMDATTFFKLQEHKKFLGKLDQTFLEGSFSKDVLEFERTTRKNKPTKEKKLNCNTGFVTRAQLQERKEPQQKQQKLQQKQQQLQQKQQQPPEAPKELTEQAKLLNEKYGAGTVAVIKHRSRPDKIHFTLEYKKAIK